MTDKELEGLYKFTKNNAEFLDDEENEAARYVGCIHCLSIFTIEEGREADEDRAYNVIDNHTTVLCPYCKRAGLIFEDSGVKVTREILAEIKRKYPDLKDYSYGA